MSRLKNIALFIAGSLLLLHTFVPHEHHAELDEIAHIQQHQATDDLFGLLRIVFHLDFGSDHLEKFKAVSYFYLTSALFDDKKTVPTYQLVSTEQPVAGIVTYFAVPDVQYLTFRGPPHLGRSHSFAKDSTL